MWDNKQINLGGQWGAEAETTNHIVEMREKAEIILSTYITFLKLRSSYAL